MAQNNDDHKKDQKRPGQRRRTFGLIVASAVATAPLGCDDRTSTAPLVVETDAGVSEDAMNAEDALAMDTGAQVDATAAPDSDTDAGGAVDAAQEYPSGVRG
jgi:hypothetical protein